MLTTKARKDLEKSGIDERTAESLGIRIATSAELQAEVGCLGGDAYAIPYDDENGVMRYKMLSGDVRYLTGTNNGRPSIGVYEPRLVDIQQSETLIITEGEKKAIRAQLDGLPCVALGGVWMWHINKDENDDKIPHPRLVDIANGRRVLILGDSDLRDNDQARRGFEELRDALAEHSNAHAVELDFLPYANGGKVGLDDALEGEIGGALDLVSERLNNVSELPHIASKTARKVARSIENMIKNETGVFPSEYSGVDQHAVDTILSRSFFNSTSSKIYTLVSDGLSQFTETECLRFLERAAGSEVLNKTKLKNAVREKSDDAKTVAKLEKAALDAPRKNIVDELKFKQYSKVEWLESMFVDKPQMTCGSTDSSVKVVIPFQKFSVNSDFDSKHVDDFKEHFPEFDDVLNMLAASRFAYDRKKSYLWLQATSSFGKGWFTSILAEFGIVAEFSVSEIEKAMSGNPVGRDPESLKRSWILLVDEFKGVKSELKQLERSISVSPKFQMVSEIPVYAKIFTSAESVPSLETDQGVEQQFIERFNKIEHSHSMRLEDRDVFSDDPVQYRESIKSYIASKLNELVEYYKSLGEQKAASEASRFLSDFHRRRNIGLFGGSMSEGIEAMSESFLEWLGISNPGPFGEMSKYVVTDVDGSVYLTRPSACAEQFIRETASESECKTLLRRKDQLIATITENGDSKPQVFRVRGRSLRGVMIKGGSG